MQVNSVTAASTTTAPTAEPAQAAKQSFTNSDFMLLLMAQLRNQNPLDPMQDKDLMGQVAQLNSLQELQEIKSQIALLTSANQTVSAANLLGRTVTANLDDGDTITGKVEAITFKGGVAYLQIGKQSVPFASIVEVKEGE
ncbi:MAG: hypothetical protein M1281_03200 [Chloroflexi bacterium]|nr:hypothetical protein [Chloroflexota bacterium]